MKKIFSSSSILVLALFLMISTALPTSVYAGQEVSTLSDAQSLQATPRMAAGLLSLDNSTATTVILSGIGFDTGDVLYIEGVVKITVGGKVRELSFMETIPGLYNENFGEWTYYNWSYAEVDYYRLHYNNGSVSEKRYSTLSISSEEL